jgi:hypothetical protein
VVVRRQEHLRGHVAFHYTANQPHPLDDNRQKPGRGVRGSITVGLLLDELQHPAQRGGDVLQLISKTDSRYGDSFKDDAFPPTHPMLPREAVPLRSACQSPRQGKRRLARDDRLQIARVKS